MSERQRVLVVGCGRMGTSHAKAYSAIGDFEIAGLVDLDPGRLEALDRTLGGGNTLFGDFARALEAVRPTIVAVCTLPGSHEELAIRSLEAGAHVFLEKPIATTVEGGRRVVDAAVKARRKLLIGYGLRHHPSWIKFIEIARTLGKPLVMRMNLNQQTRADVWAVAKGILESVSPIVDCGVHYVDVMCQMTGASPVRVSAIGARLSDEVAEEMYNYGQLQVTFDDGSVGWYEAGWGPMMSETAFFVKDVVGPKGSVSIVPRSAGAASRSSDLKAHTKADSLRIHHAELAPGGDFARPDEVLDLSDEPDHDELCRREQRFLLKAIRENVDLTRHMNDAVNTLRIVLAADESVRTGRTVELRA
jgi:predicted dehydrogenase